MASKRKVGHRRWGAQGGKVPGRHRGDIMTAAKRSQVMAKIKGKNTSPELVIEQHLRTRKLRFERHPGDLPGRPDFVFRDQRVVVFVDGNFWHGYRFSLWAHKLSPKWRQKIALNRTRDVRNFAKLRRGGWKVIRIWEHQTERDPALCADRVELAIRIRESVTVSAGVSERLPSSPAGRQRSRST